MGVPLFSLNILILLLFQLSFLAHGSFIGLNYGLVANNLPPPSQVIALIKSRSITRIRLFSPNHDVLDALQNTGIEVILGTLNDDLQTLGSQDVSVAKTWVQNNVVPYKNSINFRCISAGNEVIPSNLSNFVLPTITNLNAALITFDLGQIAVTTAVGIYVLGNSSPPSAGVFSGATITTIQPIVNFLTTKNFPLLVNAYPYFAYAANPNAIPLSFALFNSTEDVIKDGNLGYKNLYDAMVDAVYSALEKVGAGGVEVVVSESGWPSSGNGVFTTVGLSQMYNQNLVRHVSSSGTPKRPEKKVETYIFAIFNEDLKPPGIEQNFGLFYPNLNEVYHVDFS